MAPGAACWPLAGGGGLAFAGQLWGGGVGCGGGGGGGGGVWGGVWGGGGGGGLWFCGVEFRARCAGCFFGVDMREVVSSGSDSNVSADEFMKLGLGFWASKAFLSAV